MAERDQTAVAIDDDISIAAEARRWRRQSIYRIPVSFTEQKDKRAYKPQMVAIGPYHHSVENLKEMDEHKDRAFRCFLKRSCKTNESIRQKLSMLVMDLKDAYGQLDNHWGDDDHKFLDMMIKDGCFILELVRTTSARPGQTSNCGYADNDPIFSWHGRLNIVPYLTRDMLMLENQIPMEVLRQLNSMNPCQKGCKELTKDVLHFFSQRPEAYRENQLDELSKSLHLLDLYRKSLIFSSKDQMVPPNPPNILSNEIIRSATELKDAGITIKTSRGRGLQEISFEPLKYGGVFGGELRLPPIVVDDSFESKYLNLIAFERFQVGIQNEVTSYICFMDNIIDSVEDVKLLHSRGVMKNALGSDEAVAKLFNSLSLDSTLNLDSSLGIVHKEVAEYCQKPWHKWRAYCCHNYFTNPWVAITVLAAIFIFAITIVQTVYSVLSYVKPTS